MFWTWTGYKFILDWLINWAINQQLLKAPSWQGSLSWVECTATLSRAVLSWVEVTHSLPARLHSLACLPQYNSPHITSGYAQALLSFQQVIQQWIYRPFEWYHLPFLRHCVIPLVYDSIKFFMFHLHQGFQPICSLLSRYNIEEKNKNIKDVVNPQTV